MVGCLGFRGATTANEMNKYKLPGAACHFLM